MCLDGPLAVCRSSVHSVRKQCCTHTIVPLSPSGRIPACVIVPLLFPLPALAAPCWSSGATPGTAMVATGGRPENPGGGSPATGASTPFGDGYTFTSDQLKNECPGAFDPANGSTSPSGGAHRLSGGSEDGEGRVARNIGPPLAGVPLARYSRAFAKAEQAPEPHDALATGYQFARPWEATLFTPQRRKMSTNRRQRRSVRFFSRSRPPSLRSGCSIPDHGPSGRDVAKALRRMAPKPFTTFHDRDAPCERG